MTHYLKVMYLADKLIKFIDELNKPLSYNL